jgi:hypothetical protein
LHQRAIKVIAENKEFKDLEERGVLKAYRV